MDDITFLYGTVLEKKGCSTQIVKAMEEMAELTQALCKFVAEEPNASISNIQEEIADVTIMMEQMRILFFPTMVDRAKQKKLDRLALLVDTLRN